MSWSRGRARRWSHEIHYYRSLAQAHVARGLALDLVMAHAETERVFEYVRAGDRVGLAHYLAAFADRLKAAGAELIAFPAVTPHFCEAEFASLSPLPIVSIFPPLQKEIASRKTKRVAVFGTRFAIKSHLFGRVSGVEFCHPLPDEVEFIHQTYAELAQQGKGTEEQWLGLTPHCAYVAATRSSGRHPDGRNGPYAVIQQSHHGFSAH